MRMLWGMLALLAASVACAKEVEYKRGEFSFSVVSEPAFAAPQDVPAQWDPKAPGNAGAPWRVWLFEEQVDRRAGSNHAYFDYVYEVKDASLLGSAGRYQIVFNPAYQRLLIHRVELRRGGKWQDRLAPDRISLARREQDFEKDMADGNVTALIVLDDVRVDDVIRLRYSIVGSNPILAGKVLDGNRFGWNSPILRNRLRVLYPPGQATTVHRENDAPAPVIRNTDVATEVVFEAQRIRAYVDEGTYPVWYQPYPQVLVSEARSWADVVAWAVPLYPKADTLPADLESLLAQWSKLGDPYAKIDAALRAVQEQVRYFGVEMGENTHRPTPPGETWTRRYGDCKDKTYLLTTLLGRMGISAVPALLSTSRGRAIADSPPATSVFDHVVVRAQVDGHTLWLDPTVTGEGGDPRQSDLSFYGVALPVAPGVGALETIVPPGGIKPSTRISERYEPASDGQQVKLIVETTWQGRSADYARRSLAGARIDQVSRHYAEYYRKRFGDLDVVGVPSILDDRQSNTLKLAEHYLLKAPFDANGGVRTLEVYGEALSSVAQLPDSIERTGPLNVGLPTHYRHEVEVSLPERWAVSLGDESVHYKGDAFTYEREVKVQDRSVRIVYDLDVLARDVASDKVAAHLGELRKVRDSLSARLPLQLPAGQANKERDTRLKALLKSAMEEGTQ
ncbi:hypothetical protein GCM10027431_19370 [Lysobacter rhizosphaerae]